MESQEIINRENNCISTSRRARAGWNPEPRTDQLREYIEIFCRCSLEACEKRDQKGIYKKARAGDIPEFTGISAPYEEPENPEITIETDRETIEEGVRKIISYLEENGFIKRGQSEFLKAVST